MKSETPDALRCKVQILTYIFENQHDHLTYLPLRKNIRALYGFDPGLYLDNLLHNEEIRLVPHPMLKTYNFYMVTVLGLKRLRAAKRMAA